MASVDQPYSKYFPGGLSPSADLLALGLKEDLDATVDKIYNTVQSAPGSCLNKTFLGTRGCLHHSVAQIRSLSKEPFFKNSGQCHGACEWFFSLYASFKKRYPEVPVNQFLLKVAEEFRDGIGIQAALLQKDYEENVDHLKTFQALDVALKERWDTNGKDAAKEIVRKFFELDDGVYFVSFSGCENRSAAISIPGHVTLLIRDEGLFYYFDPNVGLAVGQEKGIDALKDMLIFATIFQNYLPHAHANELFERGAANLKKQIGPDKTTKILDLAAKAKEDKPYLNVYVLFEIIDQLTAGGMDFSDKERSDVVKALSIDPGTLYVLAQKSARLGISQGLF